MSAGDLRSSREEINANEAGNQKLTAKRNVEGPFLGNRQAAGESELGGTTKDSTMNHGSIISDAEALQILKNDLRRLALEKYAAELNNATPERTSEIMTQIEEGIEKEIRQPARKIHPGTLLH